MGKYSPGYRTLEGPKFYKHGGYYYVFAPAGGVEEGWQAVFRARSIDGPPGTWREVSGTVSAHAASSSGMAAGIFIINRRYEEGIKLYRTALAKNPDERYQSAREFYHSILNPGTVYVPPAPEPMPAKPAAAAPLPPVVAASAITPAIVALGAGLLFLLIAVLVLLRGGA